MLDLGLAELLLLLILVFCCCGPKKMHSIARFLGTLVYCCRRGQAQWRKLWDESATHWQQSSATSAKEASTEHSASPSEKG